MVCWTHGSRLTTLLNTLRSKYSWLFKQYSIIKNSSAALCFTTEAERQLARNTFWPYQCKEKVTGLGAASPQGNKIEQTELFQKISRY